MIIGMYDMIWKKKLELIFIGVYNVVWNDMFLTDAFLNTSGTIYAGSAIADAAWLIDVMEIPLPI